LSGRLGTKWLRLERRSCGIELTVAIGIFFARTAVWIVIWPVVWSQWKTSRRRVVALGYVFQKLDRPSLLEQIEMLDQRQIL